MRCTSTLILALSLATTALACGPGPKSWVLNQGLSNPESAVYDPRTENIFVSNLAGDGKARDGIGWISRINSQGKIISEQWVSGLNAPKGIAIRENVLWVSDIDSVVKINIDQGKIEKTIFVPGSLFLNDIAIAEDGTVYVSDMERSAIIQIKNDVADVWVEGAEWESPNGLVVDGNTLYVAAWGFTPSTAQSPKVAGNFYQVDLRTKKKAVLSKKPLGQLDGLWQGPTKDTFYVSDWVAGKVFAITRKGWVGQVKGVGQLKITGTQGLADLSLSPHGLLIPSMVENKLYMTNAGVL